MNYTEQGKGKKRRWNKREDRMVLAQRRSDYELAPMIKRSPNAISQRRFYLKAVGRA